MEDVDNRKGMRIQLKRHETQYVQVDSSDPATAFTSGPYGHGSRIFAKVVETVVARLEKRLAKSADEGGGGAAAAAVAGKLDKAWREMYKRPLPSEANVEEELQKRSLRAAPLSEGRGAAGPVSTAAKLGNEGTAAAPSDLWYASDLPRAAPAARKKRRGSAATAAAAAAHKPKRRFVLKAAAARARPDSSSSSSSSQDTAGRKGRRPNDGAAVKNGERRRVDAAARGIDGRPASAAGGSEEGTLAGTSSTAVSVVSLAVPHGETECRNGGGGGGTSNSGCSGELGAALSHAEAQLGGSGSESRGAGATGDPNAQRAAASSSTAAAAAANATPQAAGGECANGQPESNTESQASGRGGGGGEEGGTAEEAGNNKSDPGGLKSGSAVASEEASADAGEATTVPPDVVVTANFVGEFLKESRRRTWRLDLEGGAIEGPGQVFVFDECECWLKPPG